MKQVSNKGSSLVEVIVAMTILVIVSIPMLNTFNRSLVINSDARKEQRGLSVDQSVLEALKGYDMDEIRKNFQKTKADFNMINGYKFEKFTELKKMSLGSEGDSYVEIGDNNEKTGKYYYSIYGVEEGKNKYDVLVTLDADAPEVDEINSKTLPQLVNVSSPGSVVLDSSGLFYSGDSYIEEALKKFMKINEDSGAAIKTKEEILDNMQCEMDININNTGAAYEVYATVKFSTIGTQISLDGTNTFHEYRADNVGYNVITTGYPKNIYVLYTPISMGDEINLNYKLDDNPGKTDLVIVANNKYHGTFDLLTSGSNSNWKDNVNILSNCNNTVFSNIGFLNGEVGAAKDKNKRIYGVQVDVYEYEEKLDKKFKGKRVSSLVSSIIN